LKQHAEYIMEDPREAGRLSSKVDAVEWVSRYLDEHIRPGYEVLEIGCGPGHLSYSAASRHRDVHFSAVDIANSRYEGAYSARNLQFFEADAHQLPFPSNSYDFVFSRLLSQYLRDLPKAISEYRRVLKPGGKLLLQDLDGQLLWHYPEDLEMQRHIQLVLDYMRGTGFDPYVGRRLYHLVHNAGFSDIDVKVESYHQIAGRVSEKDDALWSLKLDVARPQIVRALGSEEKADLLIGAFLSYLRREDTFTYSVCMTVMGTRPD